MLYPGRKALLVGGVILLHGLALWALNGGLQRTPMEPIVPARFIVVPVAPLAPEPLAAPPASPAPAVPAPDEVPPAPAPAPVPAAAPRSTPAPRKTTPARTTPPPKPRPAVASVRPKPRPAPEPPAPSTQDTAATKSTIATTPPPAAPPDAPAVESGTNSSVAALPAAPVAASVAPAPTPAASPVVVPPSSSARHLNNAPPPYPAISQRLGESGRVVVRVLIGADGRAQEARIQRSSGFDRLDRLALETVRDRWRYVPGTRAGVPEAMWFNVPISFVLE